MFWFIVLYVVTADAALVTIEQGTLNGTFMVARGGRKFNAFLGLPYAEPPVGHLRFKAPKEPKSWTGIWNASDSRNKCVQIFNAPFNTTGVTGDEDCLYLNVYTPLNAQKGDNLSVLVYLHGGVYKFGSNQDCGPNYILSRDVVMVVPNYRLGPLGFLSTGDEVIPGNFGLKDQVMALKWVQKNIRQFGGDPNKVTIEGHSAGAVAAHLHTLSPRSKGLFHQVIIQSFAGVGVTSYFGPDVSRSVTMDFAKKAGCSSTNTSIDIYDCLMKMNASDMPNIQEELYVWNYDPDAAFRPTIENKNVSNAFLTEFPEKMKYHSPHQPWIIGLTTGEGSLKSAEYVSNDGKLANEINKYYKLLFPITLQYLWDTKPKYLDYNSKVIRRHYFGDKKIGLKTAIELTDMYTDGMFAYPVVDAVLKYPGPKYVYSYDYRSNYSLISYDERYLGVSHADDIVFIIYTENAACWFTERDVLFSEELVKRWVNFVETGNPNWPVKINEDMYGAWKPVSSKNIEYLLIKLKGGMRSGFYKETYQFWKSLPIGSKYLGN